jgi:hypothetical protein
MSEESRFRESWNNLPPEKVEQLEEEISKNYRSFLVAMARITETHHFYHDWSKEHPLLSFVIGCRIFNMPPKIIDSFIESFKRRCQEDTPNHSDLIDKADEFIERELH